MPAARPNWKGARAGSSRSGRRSCSTRTRTGTDTRTFATLEASPHAINLATFACPASGDAVPKVAAVDAASDRLTADTMPQAIARQRPGRFVLGTIIAEEAMAVEVPGHHGDGVHVLFADGHVELVAVSDATSENWDDVQSDLMRPGARRVRWPASQPWAR